MLKNYWIDLTDLMAWRGNFTGIQRVVYSYATRFAKDGSKFFAYDSVAERFVEIPFESLKAKSIEATEEPLTREYKRQQLKKILKENYYEKLPRSAKNILRPSVRILNGVFRRYAAILLDNRMPDPFKHYQTVDIPHNSTLLFLGAGWHETETVRQITKLKPEKHYRVIQHINDVLPIVQPHLFSDELPLVFSDYLIEAIGIADMITVISKATQQDLEKVAKTFDIVLPPVRVLRLGEDVSGSKSEKPHVERLSDKFILSVGTFEIRKNYSLLYQAVKLAQQDNQSLPQIVIVGKKGWLTDDLRHVIERDYSVGTAILHLQNVSDAELNWLYQNCMFTIFPSLCEGWGLPIAESLMHGKTCLASGISSMLEIAPEYVDYFSPYDPRDCLEKITEYLTDDKYLNSNQKIIQSYKPFTWNESYMNLVKIID